MANLAELVTGASTSRGAHHSFTSSTDHTGMIHILRDLPGVNMIPCRKVDMYALIAGAAVAYTGYDTFFATPKGPLPAINSKMAHYALAGMASEPGSKPSCLPDRDSQNI